MMKSIVFYNLYLKNTWRSVTKEILTNRPQDDLIINVSFDLRYIYKLPFVLFFLWKFAPKKIFFSRNNAKYGETIGFNKFLKYCSLDSYNILTYIHSKGVTKPNREKENNWREFMKYFVMDRFDLTIKAFEEGFHLYGVNLRKYQGTDEERDHTSLYTDYWYRGTFVSVNLNELRQKILMTTVPNNFYGIEAFWGNLTPIDKAFSPFNSNISHYQAPFPKEKYTGKSQYPNQGYEQMM
ncbi:MAG: hypothetical protein GY827_09170 [Cytophagales bacterium]|nr:hypothetical protein [Cytophagales bacterium]